VTRGRRAKRDPIFIVRPQRVARRFELDPRSNASRFFDGARRWEGSKVLREYDIFAGDEP
jgi:hypothetical protein